MSRATIIINSPTDVRRVCKLIENVPKGSRVTVKGPQRSIEQNDKMWAMLTDVSRQKEHMGRKYTPDQWKVIFLHAIGREVQFIPALDGQGFIPWGQSSSDLSVKEMTDLIEFMFAWGAENSVTFYEPKGQADEHRTV